eukprot:TRINITY_DN7114_c0_g1_i4.p1 TRINITY_DN7114_c0_g1~~TRINITY_DN7114_c0_g1_i4.p1  ORF type:complete len:758 (-),score=191.91 TRINITY_DN7114_c0_g1_i4:16-2289(-)
MVLCRREAAQGFFPVLNSLLKSKNIIAYKQFVEHYASGFTSFTSDIDNIPQEELTDLMNQINLCFLIPLSFIPHQESYSTDELCYAYTVCRFIYHFLRPISAEYSILYNALKDDPLNIGRLQRLQKAVQKEYLTEDRIVQTIVEYPDLIKKFYNEFYLAHHPQNHACTPKEAKRDQESTKKEDLSSLIKISVSKELDVQILNMYMIFNSSLLKTNFFQKGKSALSFRFEPSFLANREFPQVPYGVFLILGKEFRGFHVRFSDIARGGLRIIRSANPQIHTKNKESLFDENYGLAYTQQLKNKDIPEGGSKGTILLGVNYQQKAEICFKKYVDALLDLLLPNDTLRDHYKKPEIVFCGPDEGTADYMDWAALHAKSRGAPFWKAFTTGKSTELGGIPHDLYGMTTRSIHQYVLGSLRYKGLQEENITKFQTGGPDGDLGSNEIKISKDNTIAIVDGSGVLYDPLGIHRAELLRLANARQMVKSFDRSLLSPQGFLVLVEDREITLPDGESVESGMLFRNEFHLSKWAKADLFVPCGGRPEAVHINNYHLLLDSKGKCRFPVIVEGANLFFTTDARLNLERAGALVFKDASANKGGVTSSSLEVLAALSLSDEEFSLKMQVMHGQVPAFYKEYVEEVQRIIESNARLEFECILQEHIKTGESCTLLSDKLSVKINLLNDKIQASNLWNQQEIRTKVLEKALPVQLLKVLSLETIVSRVPENYLKAIFGAYLASHYVYQYGLNAPEFQFTQFMNSFVRLV